MRVEVKLRAFLTLVLGGDERSASRLGSFSIKMTTEYLLNKGLGGPQLDAVRKYKIFVSLPVFYLQFLDVLARTQIGTVAELSRLPQYSLYFCISVHVRVRSVHLVILKANIAVDQWL
jgi:hypothetical protein